MHDPTERASLPPAFAPSPLSEIVLLSDFWSPIERNPHDARAAVRRPARTAISCRSSIRPRRPSPIPAASNSSSRKAAARSPPAAPRPGAPTTTARLARHRAEIRAETDKLGWSFTIHRTDRPANELLLALHARIGDGNAAGAIDRRPRGMQPGGRA